MHIIVNGRERELTPGVNLKALIEQCSPENRHLIAEINGSVVKRAGWEQTPIKDGDAVELVNLVGGG